MNDTRGRSGLGEGSMLRRRLRILRHRASRWFLPPVRTSAAPVPRDDAETPPEAWTERTLKPVGPAR